MNSTKNNIELIVHPCIGYEHSKNPTFIIERAINTTSHLPKNSISKDELDKLIYDGVKVIVKSNGKP